MEFPVRIPFVEHLGVQLEQMADGRAVLLLEPKAEHHNSFNVVHGGVSMTLLDVVMAHAARSVAADMGAVTIELKTSFMRPALGALRAEGQLLHRTATMAFTEGRIVDANGQVCAHATGTFKYVRRLPVGTKTANDLNPPASD
jgi:uncharacterized protein (TIGR00369 family)